MGERFQPLVTFLLNHGELLLSGLSVAIAAMALWRTFRRPVVWEVMSMGDGAYSLVNTGRRRARRVGIDMSEGPEYLSFQWPESSETFDTEPGRSWVFRVMPPHPDLAQGWHVRIRWGRRSQAFVPLPPYLATGRVTASGTGMARGRSQSPETGL